MHTSLLVFSSEWLHGNEGTLVSIYSIIGMFAVIKFDLPLFLPIQLMMKATLYGLKILWQWFKFCLHLFFVLACCIFYASLFIRCNFLKMRKGKILYVSNVNNSPFAVAKPLVVDGTSKSHELSLAYVEASLPLLDPPLVLQEFVNHGKHLIIPRLYLQTIGLY